MTYEWKDENTTVKHFYRITDGRILGTVWQYVNNNVIWSSKILEDEFPYTNASEKHLGHYVSQEHARRSVEHYWNIQDRTLITQ
jgi:hypothetical protein